MSYEPTNWQEGDLITSERLNKMEQGIASGEGGIFLIPAEYDSSTSNTTMQKTAGEIFEAASSGKLCVVALHTSHDETQGFMYAIIDSMDREGTLYTFGFRDTVSYANSADEYPSTDTTPGGDDSGGGDSGSGGSVK